MKQYCPACGCEQEIRLLQKDETYKVKEARISIKATVCTCAVCGEEIMSIEYDDQNLRNAYAQYRELHGLLQPHEIKAIRDTYGVSQVTFARILGVGDKTIARYENGSLQDEAINNLILLAADPKNLRRLLEKNEELISADEAQRLKAKLGEVRVFAVWEKTPKGYTYNLDPEDDLYRYVG